MSTICTSIRTSVAHQCAARLYLADFPYPNRIMPDMDTVLHSTALNAHVSHARVFTTKDGSLVIKLALPGELAFYCSFTAPSAFDALRPFVPKFLGIIKLKGHVDPPSSPLSGDDPLVMRDSIVLENLSYPFLRPNIMDIKLGTVFYDDSASPEKVKRRENGARRTTSFETGVRLADFQVYDNSTGQPINIPKSYGKSITPAGLPDGFARLFPVAPQEPPALPTAEVANTGLPCHLLLPILRAMRSDLVEIRQALAQLEVRMVGASLLVIYEAEWARVAEGVRVFDLMDGEPKSTLYVVKLIDFAHTKMVPGAGPDEGLLKGIDTVLRLLSGRIDQVAKMDV